jgi:metal-responsive CopG/Arc/MetJ family transcriptional regulator
MKRTTQVSGKNLKMQSAPAVRASISFPPNLYETLEEIAKQKKVSLAWVVRDAAEKYIADQPAETGKARADAH